MGGDATRGEAYARGTAIYLEDSIGTAKTWKCGSGFVLCANQADDELVVRMKTFPRWLKPR
jgi:hypothetical protein